MAPPCQDLHSTVGDYDVQYPCPGVCALMIPPVSSLAADRTHRILGSMHNCWDGTHQAQEPGGGKTASLLRLRMHPRPRVDPAMSTVDASLHECPTAKSQTYISERGTTRSGRLHGISEIANDEAALLALDILCRRLRQVTNSKQWRPFVRVRSVDRTVLALGATRRLQFTTRLRTLEMIGQVWATAIRTHCRTVHCPKRSRTPPI